MILVLKISSTNKNSLKRFETFLTKTMNDIKSLNFFIINATKKKISKTKFSVLKSPHVNKKSKEQFEIKNYTKVLKIHSYQYIIILFLIKRIRNSMFSDIKLKINLIYNVNRSYKNIKVNCNLNNKFYKTHQNISTTKNYLKCLDIFGETLFKNLNLKIL